MILVPLSEDRRLAIPDLSVAIDPTPQNGCAKRCYALSHCVATTSTGRIRPTSSRISMDQLLAIRRQIARWSGCTLLLVRLSVLATEKARDES